MSDSKDKKDELKVLTPPFRISFPNVFKPRAAFENQDPTYNIQMLFPKTAEGYPEKLRKYGTDLITVKKALAAACNKEWGEKSKWPKFKHPVIRDGNEKQDMAQYKEMFFINAKSKFAPGIVNQKNDEIISPEEFYAGGWARATLNVYTYDNKFGAGPQLGLQNLQFLMDDESFSGKRNAKDDFEAIDGFDDDAGTTGSASEADYNDF